MGNPPVRPWNLQSGVMCKSTSLYSSSLLDSEIEAREMQIFDRDNNLLTSAQSLTLAIAQRSALDVI